MKGLVYDVPAYAIIWDETGVVVTFKGQYCLFNSYDTAYSALMELRKIVDKSSSPKATISMVQILLKDLAPYVIHPIAQTFDGHPIFETKIKEM